MPLQLRRGNTAEVNSITPLLGELIYDTQLKRIVVGDGATLGGTAVAGVTITEAKQATYDALAAGSHQNITFTQNPVTKAISASVDILLHDTIEADALVTSKIFSTSSGVVIDVDTGAFTGNLTGNVTGNINGVVTGTAGSTLIGNVTGNINGVVTGTAGSTLIGNVTGNTNGFHSGDVKGSIFADDSSILVDAIDSIHYGDFVGGDISGNIITNLISSSDSSPIVFDTPTVFQTSVNIQGETNFDNEITVNTNRSDLRAISLSQHHDAATNISSLVLRRSRGNILSQTPVQDGDFLGVISSNARTTNGYDSAAALFTQVQGTPTADYAPGAFNFFTRSDTTSTFRSRLRIDNDGGLFQTIEDYSIDSLYRITQQHNNAESRDFRFTKSRLSGTTPIAVNPNDVLGKITFAGYEGSNFAVSSLIRSVVDTSAVIGPGTVRGKLDFFVADASGTLIQKLQIGAIQTIHSGQFIIENQTINGLPLYVLNNTSTVHDGSRFGLRRSRGSYSSPSAVINGDVLFRFGFGGYDGSAYRDSAFITATVSNAVSSGIIPTKLTISTENTSGVKTPALEITDNQVVKVDTIGTLSATSTYFSNAIRLATYTDAAARNTAIPTPTAGMMVYISSTGKFQGYNGFTTTWDDLN